MSACSGLHAATLELAKGTSLKHRLTIAFSKHLSLVDPSELPASLRDEFILLLRALEAVRPMTGESAVQATVRKMSADEADRCASRIVGLFGQLASLSLSLPADESGASRPLSDRDHGERREEGGGAPMLYAVEA